MGAGNDRVGASAFARNLSSSMPPDLVLIQNDLAATHTAARYVEQLRERAVGLPLIVNYFPVDCTVRRDYSGMLEMADVNVTCSIFGQRETIWVDNSGYRPFALMGKIVSALHRALSISDTERARMISAALGFAAASIGRSLLRCG